MEWGFGGFFGGRVGGGVVWGFGGFCCFLLSSQWEIPSVNTCWCYNLKPLINGVLLCLCYRKNWPDNGTAMASGSQ